MVDIEWSCGGIKIVHNETCRISRYVCWGKYSMVSEMGEWNCHFVWHWGRQANWTAATLRHIDSWPRRQTVIHKSHLSKQTNSWQKKEKAPCDRLSGPDHIILHHLVRFSWYRSNDQLHFALRTQAVQVERLIPFPFLLEIKLEFPRCVDPARSYHSGSTRHGESNKTDESQLRKFALCIDCIIKRTEESKNVNICHS